MNEAIIIMLLCMYVMLCYVMGDRLIQDLGTMVDSPNDNNTIVSC